MVVVVLGLAVWGIGARLAAHRQLQHSADAAAVPSVVTVKADKAPDVEEIVLPGSVSPAYDATIYARTNGYLKAWHVDIGDHVRAGQVLAEIDSPEVDQQLLQARADLTGAQANSRIAGVLAHRTQALVGMSAVSQQETDQARSDASARASTVNSNQANVQRLEQLVGFEKIKSPFDGVVTARNTDIGRLIAAGDSSGPPLFRVADVSWLRVYVQVPQSYAAAIRPGVQVMLRFPEYPGRDFPARLLSTADALTADTRTLLVQLRIDNDKGELFPGGYVEVHFGVRAATEGVRIPANALLFRSEGQRVATVMPDGHVKLHTITAGRDFGTVLEVLKGIEPGDMVVINPPASLEDGERVELARGK